MCRLALFFKSPNLSEKNLASILKALEDSMGGHGNGIGYYQDGKPVVKKGVKYTVYDAARDAIAAPADSFIFHTRLASVGGQYSSNNHPYELDTFIGAHNGTVGQNIWKTIQIVLALNKIYLPAMTDSIHVLKAIELAGTEFVHLIVESGVWLRLFPEGYGNVVVYGDFTATKLKDGTMFYASEFTDDLVRLGVEFWEFPLGSEANLFKDHFEMVYGKAKKVKNPIVIHRYRHSNYDYYGSPYSSYSSSQKVSSQISDEKAREIIEYVFGDIIEKEEKGENK